MTCNFFPLMQDISKILYRFSKEIDSKSFDKNKLSRDSFSSTYIRNCHHYAMHGIGRLVMVVGKSRL